jgi:hypothetical protein
MDTRETVFLILYFCSFRERKDSPVSEFTLTADEERDVLAFDPWGERDATYKVLRQGFNVARKTHECSICFGPIVNGDRVWYRNEVDNGKAATFRFCPECCWCIAHRYDESDDPDAEPALGFTRMDDRWELGNLRARERQDAYR